MNKFDFTPGPWEIGRDHIGRDHNGILSTDTKNTIPHSSGWREGAFNGENSVEESRANDRLIAVAPEMFQLLIESIRDPVQFSWNQASIIDLIEKVIGKKMRDVLKEK